MPEQLSQEYEPTSQTIRNWVREAQKQQPASELEKDRQIRDLKAENARLRDERVFLGKAATRFAMETRKVKMSFSLNPYIYQPLTCQKRLISSFMLF
jgi:transposase